MLVLQYSLLKNPSIENWDPQNQVGIKVKTYSYFEYDEVSSALNKAIRRNQDYEAPNYLELSEFHTSLLLTFSKIYISLFFQFSKDIAF
jgi:hypothetical protein